MAINYLVDTNIFLEIFLDQNKKDICKNFLDKNLDSLSVSDFSLHSVGIILLRENKSKDFLKFVDDILNNSHLVSLPLDQYIKIVNYHITMRLDFDDAYQYSIAKYYSLTIVTMDNHFRKVADIGVVFV